ncbi:hypothetical protein PSE10B_08510 [Pseudomonas amygdali pv. eriobotryae]|nr:hypothetical protein ALO78_200274 [Pseudomonas amygdali pv. ciccaronei]MBN4175898.1 hypothetical protein [Pseudomonas savastanoi pv. phaseolicola]RMM92013.1 hypothetical protein ALQ69_03516 [Pseudomonas savastanoi pv. glycinea]SOS17872.1 hypothetical protein CFBP6109_02711 [Pseudomonas syringae pv. cerasicola]GFZ64329.1 hypothetical protein PSE10B_08510 [Pseudomonas amygdali pv. eriobotryae]
MSDICSVGVRRRPGISPLGILQKTHLVSLFTESETPHRGMEARLMCNLMHACCDIPTVAYRQRRGIFA